jgi:predicted TPR repeat methyltransferase
VEGIGRTHSGVPHRVPPKTVEAIASEWDAIASRRAHQIRNRLDISFGAVLRPTVLDLIDRHAPSADSILDVGCGTGELTWDLARRYGQSVGVDPSSLSVLHAQHGAPFDLIPRLEWHTKTIEEFAERQYAQFKTVVANMTLMDMPNLESGLAAIAAVCEDGAKFIWTFTHPCFWSRYWGYENETWFNYNEEMFIEAFFRITRETTGFVTTHIHRPLHQYIEGFIWNGFALEAMVEPMPTRPATEAYSEPWAFPRFLAGVCSKARVPTG